MSPPNRLDDWIDENEYPDDKDVEDFGDYSASDGHPLTIGYLPGQQPRFWTRGRIALLVIVLVIVAALLLPLLSSVLR